jgi:hypothetical protein
MVRVWVIGAMIVLLFLSIGTESGYMFERYPGLGRFFSAPFFAMAEHQQWSSFLNAARLGNVVSILVWLFVARPALLKRWPDLSVMTVAAVFFYQAETAYYFTSGYLEPWSLILVLLALETALTRDSAREHVIALLLTGAAAMVKEPAIFLLPLVWLAGKPWTRTKEEFVNLVFAAVAAAWPFLVYFIIRTGDNLRGFTPLSWQEALTENTLEETAHRLTYHFGWPGVILLVALGSILISALVRTPTMRWRAGLLIGMACFYMLFFLFDSSSTYFAGYPRFFLFVFLVMCAGIWLMDARPIVWKRKFLAGFSVLAVVLNGYTYARYATWSTDADPARNFNEHYDAPVFLPIRALITKAERESLLKGGEKITLINNLGWGMPSIGLNYPDLARRYELTVSREFSCDCPPPGQVKLVPFVHYAGLNRNLNESLPIGSGGPQQLFLNIWNSRNLSKEACLSELEKNCAWYKTESVNGDLVGILVGGHA